MPTYHAGTGEGYDFELFLLTLIAGLAILALLSWGIPWFRNRMRLRREARLHAEQEAALSDESMPDDTDPSRNAFSGIPTG